jgi:hypothetical protein
MTKTRIETKKRITGMISSLRMTYRNIASNLLRTEQKRAQVSLWNLPSAAQSRALPGAGQVMKAGNREPELSGLQTRIRLPVLFIRTNPQL